MRKASGLGLVLVVSAGGALAACPVPPAPGGASPSPAPTASSGGGTAADTGSSTASGSSQGGASGDGGAGATKGVSTFAGKAAAKVPANEFKTPAAMVVDASGTIFVSDSGARHCIWKVAPDGAISRIGGDANVFLDAKGFADGSAATAKFYTPRGLALDAGGNLYVADSGNHRIRKVAPDGTVTTFAGSGVQGSTAGASSSATFSSPRGIAIDGAGTLYVSDSGVDAKFRKIGTDGTVSNITWGTATAAPGYKLLADADGTLYAANFTKRNPDNQVSAVATLDGGIYGNQEFVKDASNNYYFAAYYEIAIKKVAATGGVTTYLGGTKGYADGPIASARAYSLVPVMAIDGSGAIYFVDNPAVNAKHHIRKITSGGLVSTVGEGSPGFAEGPPTAARFSKPTDLVFDKNGTLYVADKNNHRIRKIPKGGEVTTFVNFTDLDGSSATTLDGPSGTSRLNLPEALAVDSDGNLYVSDASEGVRKIAPDGTMSLFAGGGTTQVLSTPIDVLKAKFGSPPGMAFDPEGNLFVCETYTSRILKIAKDGTMTGFVGSSAGFGDGVGGRLSAPKGIAVDAAGNVYVADSGNHRIRKVTPAGSLSTLAGGHFLAESSSKAKDFADGKGLNARFDTPTDVALDAAGNVYVADSGNHRVRKVAPDGTVTTIAGKDKGFADGSAADSRLDTPSGVAIGPDGAIYVSETGNHTIRAIRE